jgi:hypothetical protein
VAMMVARAAFTSAAYPSMKASCAFRSIGRWVSSGRDSSEKPAGEQTQRSGDREHATHNSPVGRDERERGLCREAVENGDGLVTGKGRVARRGCELISEEQMRRAVTCRHAAVGIEVHWEQRDEPLV